MAALGASRALLGVHYTTGGHFRYGLCHAPIIAPRDDQRQAAFAERLLKNRILLENYLLPGDLEAQIAAFVDDYNHRRYHESIGNLTPADAYFGRGHIILAERERIKRQTIADRRLQHQLHAA